MGIEPTPDPGEFAHGDQCNMCTNNFPIFVPGCTPATVHLTRYGGPGDPTTFDLPQIFPCAWLLDAPFIKVEWDAVIPVVGGSRIYIQQKIAGIWTITFNSADARFCIKERSNGIFPGAVGTHAIVEWG